MTGRLAVGVLLLVSVAHAALPEPPKQHEPWQPPSSTVIPAFVVKVATVVFDAGLADPRGGAYREAEILNLHGGKDTLQTHAWVFPGGYAVCWNGLVYRVRGVGAPVDLAADVRIILAARPWSGRWPIPFQGEAGPAEAAFWSDLQTIQTIVPASIALLLRLGRTDLAEQLWQAPEVPDRSGLAAMRETEEGPWLATAATAWFATAYWRLVGAFAAGNDQDAKDVAESILEWRSRVPANWRIRNPWVPKRIPDISFLEPVPDLLGDSRRRLEEPKHEAVDLQAVVKAKAGSPEFMRRPQAARVAYLIEHLEDVRGQKVSFPGSLVYSFDPVYEELQREGKAAVAALLDAYENDRRLTRTFDYGRPWSLAYTPISVHTITESLLGDILGDSARVGRLSPTELRAWWQKQKTTD